MGEGGRILLSAVADPQELYVSGGSRSPTLDFFSLCGTKYIDASTLRNSIFGLKHIRGAAPALNPVLECSE